MADSATGDDLVNICVFVILETIVKRMASVKEYEQPISQVDGKNLKQRYYWMKWSIHDQLEECWELWKTTNQSELTVECGSRRIDRLAARTSSEGPGGGTTPANADKLKGEHDKFLAQKTLRMETLRSYCNLDYISDWSR